MIGPKRALPITEPRKLAAAMASLQARERRILELRYGIGETQRHSLAQVGRRFGLSGERVRQIETRALQRLAEADGKTTAEPAAAAKPVPTPEASLPRNALQAWTLLQLRRQPSHGYDLLQRLDWPWSPSTPARLYRLLRDLEQGGLVRSDWAEGVDAPDRRVYNLTRKGARQLQHDAQGLQRLLETLQRFFADYAHASGQG